MSATAIPSGSAMGLVQPIDSVQYGSLPNLNTSSQPSHEQALQQIVQLLEQMVEQLAAQLDSRHSPTADGGSAASAPQGSTATSPAAPPALPAATSGGFSASQPGIAPCTDRCAAGAANAGAAGGAPNGNALGASSADSTSVSGGTDLENAMSATEQNDPALFAKTMKDAKSGDGNSLVEDELQAYKEGDISKQQCIEEVSGAQKLANDHGGGKINGKVKKDAENALGGSYIKGGQTRAGHAIVKALESFTPIGAIVKGVQDKTSKKSEDILSAAQPALKQGSQQAMQALAHADPSLAEKFQQDAKKGDGNAMVHDLIEAHQEAPDRFTKEDADMLASQVGDAGKGKVSKDATDAYAQAFGNSDALYRGSSRGAKAWNKIEDGVGGFMQNIVSPVTDTVGGVDDLLHGDIKGAFSQFGQAFVGAASDVAMVFAPEAAPELMAGETALRGGMEAGSTLNTIVKGAKMVDKADKYYDHAQDAMNYLNGNDNQQQQPPNA